MNLYMLTPRNKMDCQTENLSFFLSHAPGFAVDNEVTNGMYECLHKMVEDLE